MYAFNQRLLTVGQPLVPVENHLVPDVLITNAQTPAMPAQGANLAEPILFYSERSQRERRMKLRPARSTARHSCAPSHCRGTWDVRDRLGLRFPDKGEDQQ